MADEEHNADDMSRFIRQGRRIREVLQAVEDALVDSGYDDFVVATQRGTFHWQTVERARAEMPEPQPGDELEH